MSVVHALSRKTISFWLWGLNVTVLCTILKLCQSWIRIFKTFVYFFRFQPSNTTTWHGLGWTCWWPLRTRSRTHCCPRPSSRSWACATMSTSGALEVAGLKKARGLETTRWKPNSYLALDLLFQKCPERNPEIIEYILFYVTSLKWSFSRYYLVQVCLNNSESIR